MTGRYEPSELASLYERTDFGIVSLRKNQFTEHTLANKFFDYAALGKPFVYTDIAPLRRVMNEMKSGVAFQAGSPESFADAVDSILKAAYDALSRNGIVSVRERFNWTIDTDRLLRSIDAVTREARS